MGRVAGWVARGDGRQIYRLTVVLLTIGCFFAGPIRGAGAQEPVTLGITDTLPPPDSLAPAAPPPTFSGSTADFRMSPDSLDAPVDYRSQDSMYVDLRAQKIHLYGDARVDYGEISLTANHIVLDYGTNEVVAEPWPDSSGTVSGKPTFSDGGQEIEAGSMRYNFRSRKGLVYESVTTQDDIFVRGGKSKFVSGAVAIDDTTDADVIYTTGAIFTTCTADHPHFGIRTRRAKVVPGKLAVIGPSNLEIAGVPTPLWLPFGFFPLKSGRSSGLLFPSDWQYSPQFGFGAQGIGWFFPLGEHVNLQLTADLYLRGTFNLYATSSYVKRYKYTGNFQFDYSRLKQETRIVDGLRNVINSGISLRWSHRQDRRAHPTFNFGGSINFSTNRIDQRFRNDYQTAATNITRSSMNLTKTFPNLKSTLTAGFTHSQNNTSEVITVNFPDARFVTQTIYPLRGLGGPNPRAWYKKLSFRYQSALRTEFTGRNAPATDSTSSFFSQQTLDDGKYGFQHSATAALSLNVLKYFNVSPNVRYEETYYGKTFDYDFDPTTIEVDTIFNELGQEVLDTTGFGDIVGLLNPGLASFREFSSGVSISTQLFGKVRFRGRGLFGLRGLRHVLKPSVSLNYQPSIVDGRDYISGQRYFLTEREINPASPDVTTLYSPFDDQIFGTPSRSRGNMNASYSISNLFEAKVWNRKDSTAQNVKLFQDIRVSGSYDLGADSLQWSPVRVSGSTKFFRGVTRVSLGAEFDPYLTVRDPRTNRLRRSNTTTLAARGAPAQLTQFRATFSTNITVDKIRQLFQGQEEKVVTDLREERRREREEANALFEETDLLSLFERFSISHTFTLRANRRFAEIGDEDQRDRIPFEVGTNSVSLRGAVQLTENWGVNVGQIGYDFLNKRPTYPSLSITRDLHCWEMRFGWQPQRRTYQFGIAVKPGTLDFIEVPVNQNRYDASNF